MVSRIILAVMAAALGVSAVNLYLVAKVSRSLRAENLPASIREQILQEVLVSELMVEFKDALGQTRRVKTVQRDGETFDQFMDRHDQEVAAAKARYGETPAEGG